MRTPSYIMEPDWAVKIARKIIDTAEQISGDYDLDLHNGIVSALTEERQHQAKMEAELSNYKFLTGFTPEECRYLKSNQERLEQQLAQLREENARLKKLMGRE